jgi:hypothetical protein
MASVEFVPRASCLEFFGDGEPSGKDVLKPSVGSSIDRGSRSSFRESDVKRLIRAARSAGIDVARVEVAMDGRIVVVAKGAEPDAACDLDAELAAFEDRHNGQDRA